MSDLSHSASPIYQRVLGILYASCLFHLTSFFLSLSFSQSQSLSRSLYLSLISIYLYLSISSLLPLPTSLTYTAQCCPGLCGRAASAGPLSNKHGPRRKSLSARSSQKHARAWMTAISRLVSFFNARTHGKEMFHSPKASTLSSCSVIMAVT